MELLRALRTEGVATAESEGVGTLASARALCPLYENVPYFRDGDGELRRSVAPTRDRGKAVRSKLRHRN
jgi:hypothetical protein